MFIVKEECPCCMNFIKTGDFFHDKETWDKHHNAGWVDGKSDWKSREEIKDELEKHKEIWLRWKKFEDDLK
jgi:hypothetical protein